MARIPTVSVVIPTFNHGRYVHDAIESVLNQSFQDLELIVVDDGSTDETRDVVDAFGARIRYVHQQNRGLASARNRGIGESVGKLIAFLDADDLWLPEKLERQLDVFQRQPAAGLVYAGVYEVDSEKHVLRELQPKHRGHIFADLLLDNVITGSGTTAVVSRECLRRIGGFDERFPVCEDWELWIRIARQFDVDYVEQALAQYRLHGSNTHRNQERMKAGRLAVLDKIFADCSASPGLAQQRRRAYGAAYRHFAFFYYFQDEFGRARTNLIQAIQACPRLLLDRDVALYTIACLLGPRFIHAARRCARSIGVRQQLRADATGRGMRS